MGASSNLLRAIRGLHTLRRSVDREASQHGVVATVVDVYLNVLGDDRVDVPAGTARHDQNIAFVDTANRTVISASWDSLN